MIPAKTCEPFFENMRKCVDLDANTMELLASRMSKVTLQKKQIILREGDVCNKIYFIISGTARSYYVDASGFAMTWFFHFHNSQSIGKHSFAVDYRTFLNNEPSFVAIETLTEVQALSFTRETQNYWLKNSPTYANWMRKLTEHAYVSMYERAFKLLTMSASERYHRLLNEEAHLMKMFSNQYIASYLGIAPQSLSRIRTRR